LLAESAGLSGLVEEYVTVAGSAGANAEVKVGALVAGMVAGADSISDMDLLRHGGDGPRLYWLFAVRGERPVVIGVYATVLAALARSIRVLSLVEFVNLRPVRLMFLMWVWALS